MYSQDAASSSIYGSYGYFQRFRETQNSPFDGDFGEMTREENAEDHPQQEDDEGMAGLHPREDNKVDGAISSIIIDEASCYFSEESDDEPKSLPSNGKDFDQSSNSNLCNGGKLNHVLINNTTLNVLRCIGRYVQMCKLLHSISPHIVSSMLELIDFYLYAVLEIFSTDVVSDYEDLYLCTSAIIDVLCIL